MKYLGHGISCGLGVGLPLEEILPLVLFGFRSTPTYFSGLAPIEVVLGYAARLPMLPDYERYMSNVEAGWSCGARTREHARIGLRRILQGEAWRIHLTRSREAMEKGIGKFPTHPKLSIGDLVVAPMLQTEIDALSRLGSRKLQPCLTEPLRVTKVERNMAWCAPVWTIGRPRPIALDQLQAVKIEGYHARYQAVADVYNQYSRHRPDPLKGVRLKRPLGEFANDLIDPASVPVAKKKAQALMKELTGEGISGKRDEESQSRSVQEGVFHRPSKVDRSAGMSGPVTLRRGT